MIPPLTQSLTTTNLLPSTLLPTSSTNPHHFPTQPRFHLSVSKPSPNPPFHPLRCSLSLVSEPPLTHFQLTNHKPSPAELSRTILALSSAGTLSTFTPEDDSWPLGVGVRFAVDPDDGTPLVCLNAAHGKHFAFDKRTSLNVQLEQCGLRTPQCTIQGNLHKPNDPIVQKKLQSLWEKRFGEEVNIALLYILAVERVLQIEDFMEDGVWITSSDYRLASPDPLRDFAEKIVLEINAHNTEDVHRFCNIYVDSDIQVVEAKMVWVDRLGFDMRLSSPQNDVFEVRIPFPREVTDEKGAKSSFNCMSQLAWEVERSYLVPDFQKVKQLKKIPCKGC